MPDNASEKIAVIIVDHGSRLGEANEMLERVADSLRAARPDVPVYVAHMELAEPTIAAAFAAAVRDRANYVVVLPYFLSPGKHGQQDIPRMSADAAARFPGITYAVSEPLGLDELITRLVWKRVDETLTSQPK